MTKTITITITGIDAEEPDVVLELVTSRILDGYTSGFDRNEESSYSFTVETSTEG